LKGVRQQTRVAALAAIFDVVVDRVIVAREGLEGGEMRVGYRPARNIEPLADCQILEIAAFREAMPPRIESSFIAPRG